MWKTGNRAGTGARGRRIECGGRGLAGGRDRMSLGEVVNGGRGRGRRVPTCSYLRRRYGRDTSHTGTEEGGSCPRSDRLMALRSAVMPRGIHEQRWWMRRLRGQLARTVPVGSPQGRDRVMVTVRELVIPESPVANLTLQLRRRGHRGTVAQDIL